ncbi:XdhC family protein [Erwinia sp. E_sp_B01_9]|uniref:XdhC family protein n=1 Tax=Erwinia sp. E_sp_B01_9 TaxID=3039403 RepID=UPI003D9AEB71
MLEQVIGLPLRYLGLLASRRKAQHFRQLLKKEQGISDEQLEKLHAPVGLDILAETPEEIAIGILAQLIPILRQKKPARAAREATDGKALAAPTAVEATAE